MLKMKIYKTSKYLVFFLMLMAFITLPVSALGAEKTYPTICVDFQIEGQSIEGSRFEVYQIAKLGNDGKMKPEEAFRSYPVLWNIETSDKLKSICDTLMGYIERDKIEPLASGQTGADGKVEFHVDEMGIYMVVGEQYQEGGYIYTISPTLLQINDDDEYKVIFPKCEKEEKPTGDRTVIKIWKGDENVNFRPQMVEVQLLKDGQVYDQVELSEKNSWKYTWKDLSNESNWQVVEKTVLAEYYVSVKTEDKTFFITNTFDGGLLNEDDRDLPYTGTLWWPVPILVFLGIAFLIAGIVVKREK